MKRVDFSPLYRTAVGFDRLPRLLDAMAANQNAGTGFPPYNIEKTDDDDYRISISVAGFGADELSVESTGNQLVVSGEIRGHEGADSDAETKVVYLHRGIANRAFRRTFELADHVKVTSSHLENGLLHVDLVREVPEAGKPRRIEISSTARETLTSKAKKLLGSDKVAA